MTKNQQNKKSQQIHKHKNQQNKKSQQKLDKENLLKNLL